MTRRMGIETPGGVVVDICLPERIAPECARALQAGGAERLAEIADHLAEAIMRAAIEQKKLQTLATEVLGVPMELSIATGTQMMLVAEEILVRANMLGVLGGDGE